MLQRLRNKLTMEQAGVQVNLATLSISDKNMLKDFNKHRVEKTNNKTLFWIVCVMVHLNLIPNLLDFLVFGKSLNKFIITQLPQLLLVYVWAITLCTKPSLTRFVFFWLFYYSLCDLHPSVCNEGWRLHILCKSHDFWNLADDYNSFFCNVSFL